MLIERVVPVDRICGYRGEKIYPIDGYLDVVLAVPESDLVKPQPPTMTGAATAPAAVRNCRLVKPTDALLPSARRRRDAAPERGLPGCPPGIRGKPRLWRWN